MQLKGTKTEESLKAAFAGESKANRVDILLREYGRHRRRSARSRMCSGTQPRVRLVTLTANMEYLIAGGSRVIPRPVLRLAMSRKHWSPQLRARRTSTQTCTRVWQKRS